MKKMFFLILLASSINAFAWQINNPDGSTTYITQDPSGATVLAKPDGSRAYITQDPSGATKVDNGDGSTSYITKGIG
jgi:hypothetical protein